MKKTILLLLVVVLCLTGCNESKKAEPIAKDNEIIMNPAEVYESKAAFLDYVKENGPMYALGYPFKKNINSQEHGANAPAFKNYKDLVERGIRIFFKYEYDKESLCIYRNDNLYCFDYTIDIQTQNENLKKAFSDGTCTNTSSNGISCHENKEINNPGVYAFSCETIDDDDYLISCKTYEPKYHAANISKSSRFIYIPYADFEKYNNNKIN